jgi:outer membrane protein OmpA-like peptidoglycan-associated protein
MNDPFDMTEPSPQPPPPATRSLPDLIGAAILALLLLVLPVFGAGPGAWRACGAAKPVVSEQKIINSQPEKPVVADPAPEPEPQLNETASIAEPDPAPGAAVTEPGPAPIAEAPKLALPAGPAPTARVYFAFNESRVPTGVELTLAEVIAYLDRHPGSKARLVGFHDASGRNADHNRRLAGDRSAAVRDVLIAQGIEANRIITDQPLRTTGSGVPREARRVEVRIEN